VHFHERKGLTEAVRHQDLLLLENFGDHKEIVEEEDFPLMQP